jgi:hypothetical protein
MLTIRRNVQWVQILVVNPSPWIRAEDRGGVKCRCMSLFKPTTVTPGDPDSPKTNAQNPPPAPHRGPDYPNRVCCHLPAVQLSGAGDHRVAASAR